MSRNEKVTKMPRWIHFNIGMLIFLIILIYLVISIVMFFRSKHIVGYEVMDGSLSSNNIYTAIALRDEEIVSSDIAGYVNYFATEGHRVGVGNLVYTVDESGQLLDELKAQGSTEVSLSNEDLSELRTQIADFASSFDSTNFQSVYDFRTSIVGTVQKLENTSILSNIEQLNVGSRSGSINYCNATNTGIVVYSTDGYENKTFEQLTDADFHNESYEKEQLVNNALVSSGDPVYKLSTNENWSVAIETDPETAVLLEEMEYVKVRFLKNQDESWGKVSYYTNGEGTTFVKLSFTNSMVTFVTDRFLEIELLTEEQHGLKIPNSAIAENTFYVIPKEYVTNDDSGASILRVTYLEDGTESSEMINCEIYNETDTSYYLDDSILQAGDVLIKEGSQDRHTVSQQDTLIGVYNINKGYADFKQINILYQNQEYSIVQSNTTYGLSVYDFIALDASAVEDDELIYD